VQRWGLVTAEPGVHSEEMLHTHADGVLGSVTWRYAHDCFKRCTGHTLAELQKVPEVEALLDKAQHITHRHNPAKHDAGYAGDRADLWTLLMQDIPALGVCMRHSQQEQWLQSTT
jgi:hypothetical protein